MGRVTLLSLGSGTIRTYANVPLVCKKCGVVLTENNWKIWGIGKKKHWRVCDDCSRKYHRELRRKWIKEHPEIIERIHNYNRQNYIRYHPKDEREFRVRVKKRPYPNSCETCGRHGVRLYWHHWDDKIIQRECGFVIFVTP